MGVSRKCDNCFLVKRCLMAVTRAGKEYLCRPCIRKLGYVLVKVTNLTDKPNRVRISFEPKEDD
jgi:hypothetical protein